MKTFTCVLGGDGRFSRFSSIVAGLISIGCVLGGCSQEVITSSHPDDESSPLPQADFQDQAACARVGHLDTLRDRISRQTNPCTRELDLLLLAGHLVCDGDWEGAQEIYEELAEKSEDLAVREAVARNREVLGRQLAVNNQSDPERDEPLAQDRAEPYHHLGDAKVSKRMNRRLSERASNPI